MKYFEEPYRIKEEHLSEKDIPILLQAICNELARINFNLDKMMNEGQINVMKVP